jgi:short-subunit dehydrogenase
MTARRILILGALSAIAEETARLYAAEGASLVLVGRNAARLAELAADLSVRGARSVEVEAGDLTDTGDAMGRVAAWSDGRLDAAFLFYGELGDQAQVEGDPDEARRILEVNFTSQALWALALAARFEAQRRGRLVIISSVAGDRGRMSNYVYGASKGAMSLLGQGIAHRLAHSAGASAVVVKLGFVRTPMTAGTNRSGPLWSDPAAVARVIRKAEAGRGVIVYAPWFWRFILLVIRLVPAAVFHRTRL